MAVKSFIVILESCWVEDSEVLAMVKCLELKTERSVDENLVRGSGSF